MQTSDHLIIAAGGASFLLSIMAFLLWGMTGDVLLYPGYLVMVLGKSRAYLSLLF